MALVWGIAPDFGRVNALGFGSQSTNTVIAPAIKSLRPWRKSIRVRDDFVAGPMPSAINASQMASRVADADGGFVRDTPPVCFNCLTLASHDLWPLSRTFLILASISF